VCLADTTPKRSNIAMNPIHESLERVPDDLTAAVYERLFAAHPGMKPLFWRDTSGAVRGEMLARVFEIILDFTGDNLYAANMIRAEIVTHAGYDVPPDVFRTFFPVVAAAVREALGDSWTDSYETAWRQLLTDLDNLTPSQP
jgi:hemoglobin-like flavoprotein